MWAAPYSASRNRSIKGSGQLLDEPTMKLLGEKGIWLSVQTLQKAPPTASANTKAKKHMVVESTDNAFRWAKKYSVKLA
jgi:hypothetical protein